MSAWGRRLLAGLLLLPPLTPLGILLWYQARRAEQKAQKQADMADAIVQAEQRQQRFEDT